MSDEKKYSGLDVSEAIASACNDLKVNQDQLNIEVISPGSPGFFGLFGKKKSIVKVSLKGRARKSTGRPQKADKEDRQPKASPRRSSDSSRSPEKAPPAVISQGQLAEVKNDLEKILELMGFPTTVEVANEANKIIGHIAGDHHEAIIGPGGQTLDSIQYLMRKIISRRIEGKVMFSLDAGEYRDQRHHELEEKAAQLAEEVRQSGRTKSIPALNPSERRIVHMTLQNDRSIRSRSVGDGHFKKILIYLPSQDKKKKDR